MAKGKTSVFFCQECGYESSKWMGQCPACKEWNTFVEETVDKKSISSSGKVKKKSKEAQVMLNENIRNLRKANGLSQEELAIKLNVVRQTVSKWEKGVSHN